ncbi:hypothetical protein [Actinomyces ruminis]|uniref:hypothetical protein n=1 Tax=Actinomyces ruminis TaxID=1937003 RepID=UPI00117872FE|nr:hypothetical protein [Actinomyces ruminis]
MIFLPGADSAAPTEPSFVRLRVPRNSVRMKSGFRKYENNRLLLLLQEEHRRGFGEIHVPAPAEAAERPNDLLEAA